MTNRLEYELIDYDVWGNERDGYNVNQAFRTGKYVSLLRKNVEDDRKLIRALKSAGIIKKGIHTRSIEVSGESDYTIYFEYKGRPEFELRRIEDEN